MDEIKMVERLFAEPPPSTVTTAAGRDRLVRLAVGGAQDTSGGRRTRTLRWSFGTGLAAAVAAVAGIMIAGAPASAPQRSPASQVLLAAATHSAATPPGTGKYLQVSTETGMAVAVGPKGHGYEVLTRRSDERWYPNAPGVSGWYRFQKLGARPATPADEAAWRADGSPQQWQPQCDGVISVSPSGATRLKAAGCPPVQAKGGRPDTEWMGGSMAAFLTTPNQLDFAKLSADPTGLKQQLLTWTHGGGLAGPVQGDANQLWAAVDTVLFNPQGPVSPQVRAAGYRILAGMPGVRSLGKVTDPSGRKGEGLSMTIHGSQDTIIVDAATGFPLADVEYSGPSTPGLRSGVVSSYRMVLRDHTTDRAPQHSGPCTPDCH